MTNGANGRGTPAWTEEERVTLAAMLAPLVERWRLLVGLGLTLAALAAAVTVLRKPRYDAALDLATVSSAPNALSSLGGAAALLTGAGAAQGGFQVNPPLVANLLESRRVLAEVGMSTVPGSGRRVADVLADKRQDEVEAVRTLDRAVDASVSKETGLVTLHVSATDSGLARLIAGRIVDATTRAYVETARAQATQMRQAHQVRVDSAGRRLGRAQEALVGFLSANRVVSEFSATRVREDAVRRELTLANEIYMKAVGDRESAVAKELEQTPVVVVVDPLPDVLPRKPRYVVLATALGGILGLLVGLVVVYVGEGLRREARSADPQYARLRAAVAELPFVRRSAPAVRDETVG